MKEFMDINALAQRVNEALPKGILLNTQGEKFNAMVIGWGGLGTVWGRPAFTVYVREGRYTREALDQTGAFTISVPLEKPDPAVNKVCGWQSGRDVDKAAAAGLHLEPAEVNGVPGVREYPITLECRVLYAQKQDLERIPEDIRARMYPQDVDGAYPMANRDAHVMYIGEIVSAYRIRQE